MANQDAIQRAIARANPDQDGSLMQELRNEGVDHIIEEGLRRFDQYRGSRSQSVSETLQGLNQYKGARSRRSKYVPGWRTEMTPGENT